MPQIPYQLRALLAWRSGRIAPLRSRPRGSVGQGLHDCHGYPIGLPWITMRTVAETPTFSRQADKLFNEGERRELIDYLAEHPLAGSEIPGTGGVRKMRFGASGRRKRGGARVIYFFGGEGIPIYALLAYTPDERRAVAALAAAVKLQGRQRK